MIVVMKKLIISLVLVFSFLAVRQVTADWWSLPTISIPTIIINTPTPTLSLLKLDPGVFKLITTSTPTPTNTPTATPTSTLTPTPTTTVEPTVSVSPTSTASATTTVTPTTKPEEKKTLSQKDMIYGGTISGLVLVVLYFAWPSIKKLLHDKTA